jgi:hypothetical protein
MEFSFFLMDDIVVITNNPPQTQTQAFLQRYGDEIMIFIHCAQQLVMVGLILLTIGKKHPGYSRWITKCLRALIVTESTVIIWSHSTYPASEYMIKFNNNWHKLSNDNNRLVVKYI